MKIVRKGCRRATDRSEWEECSCVRSFNNLDDPKLAPGRWALADCAICGGEGRVNAGKPRLVAINILENDGTLRAKHVVEDNHLYDLAERCRTSKLYHSAYMHAYWHHLGPLQGQPLQLLEIGVETGASLRLWREFLPRATVFAIDCDPAAAKHVPTGVEFFLGHQEDAILLQRVVTAAGGQLDVVVDDGSHEPAHQQFTLTTLWPYLSPGGWYVVEDLETSYLDGYPAGPSKTVEVIKAHVDYVNREYVRQYAGRCVNSPLTGLVELHFYPNVCFLRKAAL